MTQKLVFCYLYSYFCHEITHITRLLPIVPSSTYAVFEYGSEFENNQNLKYDFCGENDTTEITKISSNFIIMYITVKVLVYRGIHFGHCLYLWIISVVLGTDLFGFFQRCHWPRCLSTSQCVIDTATVHNLTQTGLYELVTITAGVVYWNLKVLGDICTIIWWYCYL
jgi:hypothetical protein